MNYLDDNNKNDTSFLSKFHRMFCDRVYLFLYRLTSICEDKRTRAIADSILNETKLNAERVEYLDQNKQIIMGGFEELKARIFELENQLEYYKSRERMVDNEINTVIYLREIIDHVWFMSRTKTIKEIDDYLTNFKSKG